MKYNNFKEFEEHYSELCSQKKYEMVLEQLDKAKEVLTKDDYDKNLFTISLDKARIFSELKDNQKCFEVITDTLEKGFSFPIHWKRFDFLRQDKRYSEIERKNELLLKRDREAAEFKYEVHLPDSYDKSKKYPVIFILHGDGADGNIEDLTWYWKHNSLVEQGFIVVYPQSSQVYCYNGFGWLKDPLLSRKEIKDCYEKIKNDYVVDEDNVILAGFSGGAMAVYDFVMADVVPARGFVSLCPGGIDYERAAIEEATKRGAKGVIMEGEYELEPPIQDLLKELDEVGFSYEYYINKEIGHWYPKDLDEKVNRAIKYLLGK